jgi:membrane protein required for colicin V production
MNWLDLAVIGIVALSAIFAFARGFVREALSIVAWVGAAVITLYGFEWAYAQIDPHVHNPLLSQVIAGLGLFVGSLVVLTILTGILARMVHAVGLSPIDRTLGFIFGLARGVFLVCLAYLLVTVTLPPNDFPSWLSEAKSKPYLHEGADMLKGVLPESLKVKSAEASDAVIRKIDPKAGAAAQAKEAAGALANPSPPAAQPGPAPAPSYRPGNQRELDRLIGTQR